MTKIENMKNGQIPKNRKKIVNLVVSKPEHHSLRRKSALKTKFEFSRKMEHSLIAETMLQVEKIKRKMEAKFNNPIFN